MFYQWFLSSNRIVAIWSKVFSKVLSDFLLVIPSSLRFSLFLDTIHSTACHLHLLSSNLFLFRHRKCHMIQDLLGFLDFRNSDILTETVLLLSSIRCRYKSKLHFFDCASLLATEEL